MYAAVSLSSQLAGVANTCLAPCHLAAYHFANPLTPEKLAANGKTTQPT